MKAKSQMKKRADAACKRAIASDKTATKAENVARQYRAIATRDANIALDLVKELKDNDSY